VSFIIGVDPGFNGGITRLNFNGLGEPVMVHDMPTVPGPRGKTELNHPEVFRLFSCYATSGPTVVWLEKVGVHPRDGKVGAFSFGRQVGALEMAVAAHGHVLRYVTPAVWKNYFGLSADKGVARGYAMKRFPALADQFSRVRDDGRAESALIALYGAEHSK
jgi:crossover junction endodeoxyribonuclease RuvC